jgi:hypothetical protein
VEEQDLQFADLESGQQLELRRVSRAALAALLLSLLSLSILASPVFWFLPAASVVTAMFALRAIRRSSGKLLGRKSAVGALILGMFLLGYAPARYVAFQISLKHRAETFAKDWLNRLQQGQLKEAHQLTLMYHERAAPAADLEKHYEQRFPSAGDRMRSMMEIQDPYSDLMTFLARPPIDELAASAKELTWQLEGSEIDSQSGDTTIIKVYCQVTLPGQYGSRVVPLQLEMERKFVRELSTSYWRVRNIVDASAAPKAT